MRPYHALAICAGVTALSACSADQLTGAERRAIGIAEQFVRRHGFTPEGHPQDQPVLATDINEAPYSADQIVAIRKGSLNARAVGVARTGMFSPYYVLFVGPQDAGKMDKQPFFVVEVEDSDARRVHQVMIFRDWKPNDR